LLPQGFDALFAAGMALQAGMAETAIRRSPKKTQGREALMGAWRARTTIKARTKAKKKVKPF
jgi:hypothetical protein